MVYVVVFIVRAAIRINLPFYCPIEFQCNIFQRLGNGLGWYKLFYLGGLNDLPIDQGQFADKQVGIAFHTESKAVNLAAGKWTEIECGFFPVVRGFPDCKFLPDITCMDEEWQPGISWKFLQCENGLRLCSNIDTCLVENNVCTISSDISSQFQTRTTHVSVFMGERGGKGGIHLSWSRIVNQPAVSRNKVLCCHVIPSADSCLHTLIIIERTVTQVKVRQERPTDCWTLRHPLGNTAESLHSIRVGSLIRISTRKAGRVSVTAREEMLLHLLVVRLPFVVVSSWSMGIKLIAGVFSPCDDIDFLCTGFFQFQPVAVTDICDMHTRIETAGIATGVLRISVWTRSTGSNGTTRIVQEQFMNRFFFRSIDNRSIAGVQIGT